MFCTKHKSVLFFVNLGQNVIDIFVYTVYIHSVDFEYYRLYVYVCMSVHVCAYECACVCVCVLIYILECKDSI